MFTQLSEMALKCQVRIHVDKKTIFLKGAWNLKDGNGMVRR